MATTEATVKLLSETNAQLKLEEKKTKEQLSTVERERGPLMSTGQQCQSQANSLYMNVTRLTNIELLLPAEFRASFPLEVDEVGTLTQCVVCDGSGDTHLMVLCDTCTNHYHIGCVDPPLNKVPKKTVRWGW